MPPVLIPKEKRENEGGFKGRKMNTGSSLFEGLLFEEKAKITHEGDKTTEIEGGE